MSNFSKSKLKTSGSRLFKGLFYLLQRNVFTNVGKCFYFTLKGLFFLKIFNFFCPDYFGPAEKLDKKAKVNFKICDVNNLEANN